MSDAVDKLKAEYETRNTEANRAMTELETLRSAFRDKADQYAILKMAAQFAKDRLTKRVLIDAGVETELFDDEDDEPTPGEKR